MQGTALYYVQKGRNEDGEWKEMRANFTFALYYFHVAMHFVLWLGSNTDQRTQLFVTNNNVDDNTAINKLICLHHKNAFTRWDHIILNSKKISEINNATALVA